MQAMPALVSAALLFTPVQSVPNSQPEQGNCTSSNEQLSQSNGVLCPPSNVDPQMTSPPPGGGNMRIIRPPGTPGGDQNVQPK